MAGFLPDSMSEGPLRTAAAALLAFHVAVSYIITGQASRPPPNPPATQGPTPPEPTLILLSIHTSTHTPTVLPSLLLSRQQPLHRTIHRHFFAATADAAGAMAALHWLCVTVRTLALAISLDHPRYPEPAGTPPLLIPPLHQVGMLAFAFLVANAIPFFDDFQNLLGSLTGAPILFGWPAFFYVRRRDRNLPLDRTLPSPYLTPISPCSHRLLPRARAQLPPPRAKDPLARPRALRTLPRPLPASIHGARDGQFAAGHRGRLVDAGSTLSVQPRRQCN